MVVSDVLTNDSDVLSITVPSGTAINKGDFVVVAADPNTGAIHTAASDQFAGVAVADKTAADGSTTVGIRVRGDIDAEADGSITLGHLVLLGSTQNSVKDAGTSLSGTDIQKVIGTCLETASDNEKVRIRLG